MGCLCRGALNSLFNSSSSSASVATSSVCLLPSTSYGSFFFFFAISSRTTRASKGTTLNQNNTADSWKISRICRQGERQIRLMILRRFRDTDPQTPLFDSFLSGKYWSLSPSQFVFITRLTAHSSTAERLFFSFGRNTFTFWELSLTRERFSCLWIPHVPPVVAPFSWSLIGRAFETEMEESDLYFTAFNVLLSTTIGVWWDSAESKTWYFRGIRIKEFWVRWNFAQPLCSSTGGSVVTGICVNILEKRLPTNPDRFIRQMFQTIEWSQSDVLQKPWPETNHASVCRDNFAHVLHVLMRFHKADFLEQLTHFPAVAKLIKMSLIAVSYKLLLLCPCWGEGRVSPAGTRISSQLISLSLTSPFL